MAKTWAAFHTVQVLLVVLSLSLVAVGSVTVYWATRYRTALHLAPLPKTAVHLVRLSEGRLDSSVSRGEPFGKKLPYSLSGALWYLEVCFLFFLLQSRHYCSGAALQFPLLCFLSALRKCRADSQRHYPAYFLRVQCTQLTVHPSQSVFPSNRHHAVRH